MAKQIIYGEHKFPVPLGMSLDEAQDWAAEAIPGIGDTEGHEADNGDYVFTKRAGRKG